LDIGLSNELDKIEEDIRVIEDDPKGIQLIPI